MRLMLSLVLDLVLMGAPPAVAQRLARGGCPVWAARRQHLLGSNRRSARRGSGVDPGRRPARRMVVDSHCNQRLLGSTTRLQPARNVAALAQCWLCNDLCVHGVAP